MFVSACSVESASVQALCDTAAESASRCCRRRCAATAAACAASLCCCCAIACCLPAATMAAASACGDRLGSAAAAAWNSVTSDEGSPPGCPCARAGCWLRAAAGRRRAMMAAACCTAGDGDSAMSGPRGTGRPAGRRPAPAAGARPASAAVLARTAAARRAARRAFCITRCERQVRCRPCGRGAAPHVSAWWTLLARQAGVCAAGGAAHLEVSHGVELHALLAVPRAPGGKAAATGAGCEPRTALDAVETRGARVASPPAARRQPAGREARRRRRAGWPGGSCSGARTARWRASPLRRAGGLHRPASGARAAVRGALSRGRERGPSTRGGAPVRVLSPAAALQPRQAHRAPAAPRARAAARRGRAHRRRPLSLRAAGDLQHAGCARLQVLAQPRRARLANAAKPRGFGKPRLAAPCRGTRLAHRPRRVVSLQRPVHALC